jgi:hypothetical protein
MKRIFAILLPMLLAAAMFAGCTAKEESNAPRTTQAPAVVQTTQAPEMPQVPNGAVGALTREIAGIFKSGTYHEKILVRLDEGDMVNETYFKGYFEDGPFAMMQDPYDGPPSHYVRKDGYLYEWRGNEKQVTKVSLDVANFSYSGPPEFDAMSYIGTGKAVFLGEELAYDEYFHHNRNRQEFYFVKDGTLKGVRYVADGAANDVEFLVFEAAVPDSVFDIPADYTVVG